jgi:predicted transcriptional regulator
MRRTYKNFASRIVEMLENNPGQTIKELAAKLNVNRSFLAGYLKALEDKEYIRSREVGPARIYFNNKGEH